jgi:hypothetical protein
MLFLTEAGAAAMGMEPWVNPFPAAAKCHLLVPDSLFLALARAISLPVVVPFLAALQVGFSVIPVLRAGLSGRLRRIGKGRAAAVQLVTREGGKPMGHGFPVRQEWARGEDASTGSYPSWWNPCAGFLLIY